MKQHRTSSVRRLPPGGLVALLCLLPACPAPIDDDDTADDDDAANDDDAVDDDDAADDDDTVDDDDAVKDDDDAAPGDPAICGGDWLPEDFTTVYDVGPNQALAEPADVPWESISASTLVRIHARAAPYAAKWVLAASGTETDPVVVAGVPDSAGNRPVITGDGATTRLELDYWNEGRSVVKIGGSSNPSATPSWIYVEGLEIRSAHPAYSYTDDGGNPGTYADNAASIHVEAGSNIFLRGNELHDSGNGLFSGSDTSDVTVACNFIHGNGNVGSAYEHNNYTESLGITFEGNHFGPLRAGADGNNLKDRSAGLTVRYNWIEGGNRQLDLVDSGHSALLTDPRYEDTWVYGNVLVEPDGAGNSQIIHYGGDSGNTDSYRGGELHLFGNTIVSTRPGNTTLVRLSSSNEYADIRNNILYAAGTLALVDEDGDADLESNWLSAGWVNAHGSTSGTISDLGNQAGSDPGFADLAVQDFSLTAGSACVDAAGALEPVAPPMELQYVVHESVRLRLDDGSLDIGAMER